jgi:hypothetical protein
MLNRRALTYEAAQEAADARDAASVQQDTAICAYDLAHALNASVRFVDVNMEGIYERGPPARILLSPYRPLVRRTFNCAHELLATGLRLSTSQPQFPTFRVERG